MALHGLLALVCAGAVVAADPTPSPLPPAGDKRENLVSATLAVQTALQQGREHLLHGDYRAAVAALESQLPYINGNPIYLKALEDAYRRYIQELRLTKQEAEAQRYLRRLIILDRGALLDQTLPKNAAAATAPPAAPKAPAKPPATVRLKSEDDDPFREKNGLAKADQRAQQLLTQAEEEFGKRHYREAGSLYEQAHQADAHATQTCRERWAYCKLFCVVDELNHAEASKPNWSALQREVARALDLAPQQDSSLLGFGKELLSEIEKRSAAGPAPEESSGVPAVAVRHLAGKTDGWLLAETANFRIFHNQTTQFAERVAQVAEQTRSRLQQRWLGGGCDAWSPKCDLFLHATAQDYSQATGQYNSPGHSFLRMENGRAVVRRIYLRCDEPNLFRATLPHETAHVVLAGEFGDKLLPRWADEGIAVLAEPRERIERHHDNLLKCQQAGQCFHLQELMQFDEYYPKDPRSISAFYAQSVALVEFLSSQRGPHVFAQFLHDGMRYGYAKALERNYGYRNFAELEQRWSQAVFHDRSRVASMTERAP